MHAPRSQPGPLEASIFVEALRAHAGVFVAGALIVHAILWTLSAILGDPTPDPKIAFGLAAGREWMLGYPGLPPLAPWLLESVYKVMPFITVMKALGPLAVALTGWFVFSLARRIVGDRHGAIATLIMVTVLPVGFPVSALDSASIQMPLTAGMVLAWWRGLKERDRIGWLLFGVAGSLSLYAGVQGIIVFLVLLGLTAGTASGRAAVDRNKSYAPALLGISVFALIATPRTYWLLTHNFSGIFEDATAGLELFGVLKSYEAVGGAVAGHLGLALLVAIATAVLGAGKMAATTLTREPLQPHTLAIVFALATMPFLIAAVVLIVLGVRTTVDAFACLLLYSGLLAVVLAGNELQIHRQRAAALLVIAFLVVPPMLLAVIGFVAPWIGNSGQITNWPAAEIARQMTDIFHNRTGKPLELVIANPLAASEIALASADHPRIFPNADAALAPWIKENTLRSKGAVVVWPVARGNTAPPAALAANLPLFVPEAPLTIGWVRPGRLDPVRLGWAIIPPQP
jgi:hypothetical protein